MRKSYQGYIYLAVSKEEDDWHWIAIKTNNDGMLISTFGEKEKTLPLVKRLQLFSKWIGNVTDYRTVAYGHECYHAFFTDVEAHYSQAFSRHLVRMMKAQLWNIKSECFYRFQIKQELSLEEMLFLYKQDWLNHEQTLVAEAINLRTLANLFLFDQVQTKKLMKKSKYDVLVEAYRVYSINELVNKLLKQNTSLSIHTEQDHKWKISLMKNSEVIEEILQDDLHEALVQHLVRQHPLSQN